MIKDKVDKELMRRFSEEIQETIKDGKEHGFLICTDEKGRLSATSSCKGEECTINLLAVREQCPFKIQGEYHTHPQIADTIKYVRENLGRDISFDIAKKLILEIAEEKKRPKTEPSHGDILGTIGLRYTKETLGTTCVGADIDPDIVECWSAKNGIDYEIYNKALMEKFKGTSLQDAPHEWTRDLFDVERINLKNSRGEYRNGK